MFNPAMITTVKAIQGHDVSALYSCRPVISVSSIAPSKETEKMRFSLINHVHISNENMVKLTFNILTIMKRVPEVTKWVFRNHEKC